LWPHCSGVQKYKFVKFLQNDPALAGLFFVLIRKKLGFGSLPEIIQEETLDGKMGLFVHRRKRKYA
jgi:hypothetical protein